MRQVFKVQFTISGQNHLKSHITNSIARCQNKNVLRPKHHSLEHIQTSRLFANKDHLLYKLSFRNLWHIKGKTEQTL